MSQVHGFDNTLFTYYAEDLCPKNDSCKYQKAIFVLINAHALKSAHKVLHYMYARCSKF